MTGAETETTRICTVRRRSENAAQCTVTLNDFKLTDLRALGIDNTPIKQIDDGRLRRAALRWYDELEVCAHTGTLSGCELDLVLRVHGPEFSPGTAKRVADDQDDKTEKIEGGRVLQRARTA